MNLGIFYLVIFDHAGNLQFLDTVGQRNQLAYKQGTKEYIINNQYQTGITDGFHVHP